MSAERTDPLFVDRYHLTMRQAHFDAPMRETENLGQTTFSGRRA